MTLHVMFEDNHLLVVDKPAGWIVQGASEDQPSLLLEASSYIKEKYHKPGKVFLGVVSRLDAPVTGLVPFARTSKAAARLSEQFRERKVEKIYWGLVDRPLPQATGTLTHWIERGPQETLSRCHRTPAPGRSEAILHYRMLGELGRSYWVEIRLETGRKHQIRSQLATVGSPLLGDTKYQGTPWRQTGIALHCFSLSLVHPTKSEDLHWTCPPPIAWRHQLGLFADRLDLLNS